MRTRVAAIVGIAASLAFSTLAVDSAAACTPGRSNDGFHYTDGWYRNISTIPGGTIGDVRASIYELSPYVAYDASFAWVMITNAVNPAQYVQIGWMKTSSGSRYVFDEATDNSSPPKFVRTTNPAFGLGGFTPYEVLWQPSTQRLETYAGGALVGRHIRYFTMREGQEFGEIHSKASQMPGGSNQHEQFTGAYVQNLNGSQYDFSGTVSSSDDSLFRNANGSSTREDIWDSACTS
jgi:hypothetical protein